jgi:glycerol-3-phosphate acyltransferase PlsX
VSPDPSPREVCVALDLLGGDRAPDVVAEGARLALADDSALRVTLVGPPEVTGRWAGADAGSRLAAAPARQVVEMGEDPLRAVRAKRDATVRVAARLLRDGAADAMVSMGSTGATLAAAVFALGRLPGLTRPALAVALPAAAGSVILLDVGANAQAGADLLAQWALAGSAYAEVLLGRASRVGLLSLGEETGKGDAVRREAHELCAELPIHFVGNVEGGDIPRGRRADVVVTDGFTGNVVLKVLEGAVELFEGRLRAAGVDSSAIHRTTVGFDPERVGGALLLGVPGVCVVGHGAATARSVASSLALAATAVRGSVVSRTAAALQRLVRARRERSGEKSAAGWGTDVRAWRDSPPTDRPGAEGGP